MRDKLRESTLKHLRSGGKLTEDERSWLIEKLKTCEVLADKNAKLEAKWGYLQKKLGMLELVQFSMNTERSLGYAEAIKDIQNSLSEI